jgi:HlyD family secretion protein
VTWVNENIGASVNPGEIIARVADLNSFKVEGQISDIHIDKINVGMPVRVRIGKNEIVGEMSSIRPTIRNGVVTFLVELDDKSNSALRSNLRVDVYVIRSRRGDVLRVKNGAAFNGSGKNSVFIIRDDKAIRREVMVGAVNFDYVEIIEGLNEGDEIIISDMEKHRNQNKLYIKNK